MNGRAIASILCGMLAALPALGGMAEMGSKKNQALAFGQEAAGTDTAAGDGSVTIIANGQSFIHVTSPGETVDFILESCETAIDTMGAGLSATHAPGSPEITITGLGGAELVSLEMLTTDSAFGYVKSLRGAVVSRGRLRAVTETPSGVNALAGAAAVRVDANARFVTVATAGHSAASLNAAIVTALVANDFDAVLAGGAILITEDNLTLGPVTVVSWEDDDTGIKSIGTSSEILLTTPTLTEWGAMLTGLLLLAGASILLTRRQAVAARRGGGGEVAPWAGAILHPALLRRWLARTEAAAGAVLLVVGLAFGRPAFPDILGTLAAAALLAYIGHLWEAHRDGGSR